jgi:multiple sugar transport system substrate-binding protein
MLSKTKIFISFLAIASLIFLAGCKNSGSNYNLDLEIWGIFDDGNAYAEIFSQYKEANKSIEEIKYKKFTVDTYKDDLLNALASGQGPDIFMIHSSWLPSFKDKIEAAPDFILGEQEFRNNFVDVVADDFLSEGKPYAVPLSVDSLALYYNRDLLNAEGIAAPPKTWEEFIEDVKRLKKIDPMGNITQAGASLGTAKNINRSTDILSLLMLQNGIQMTDQEGRATFERDVSVDGKSVRAGENAWKFYTDFARIGSPFYTWNNSMHYSIDSFFEGTSAMMLSYSYNIDTIKNKNAKLNFAISPVPQYSGKNPVGYANYWGFAVAKNKVAKEDSASKAPPVSNTVRIREAWEFIKIMTTQNSGKITLVNMINGGNRSIAFDFDPAKFYTDETKKPAARRDLINKQKTDPLLGSFAYGNLIAKSWRQANPEQIETILTEAIDSINKGSSTVSEALRLANTRVGRLVEN